MHYATTLQIEHHIRLRRGDGKLLYTNHTGPIDFKVIRCKVCSPKCVILNMFIEENPGYCIRS